MIELIFIFVLGLLLGYTYRDLRDNINQLWGNLNDTEPQKKPGVTMGSYKHINEVNPTKPEPKARGRVVTPKTPQKMSWDAEQQLKEANEKFRVGPK